MFLHVQQITAPIESPLTVTISLKKFQTFKLEPVEGFFFNMSLPASSSIEI